MCQRFKILFSFCFCLLGFILYRALVKKNVVETMVTVFLTLKTILIAVIVIQGLQGSTASEEVHQSHQFEHIV